MVEPVEYLVAATIIAVRRRSSVGALPQNRENLWALVNQTYDIQLSGPVFDLLVMRLRILHYVRIISDEYAGEVFIIQKTRMDSPSGSAGEIVTKAQSGANDLLKKVFANDRFWTDLENAMGVPEVVENQLDTDEVPAADRIVTLNHNQYNSINEPTEELLSRLAADNGIPDEPDAKDLIVGQIKAGRELLRTGVFRLSLFRMTMIAGLQMLSEKYREHAIGAAASTLLTVILHELAIPGF